MNNILVKSIDGSFSIHLYDFGYIVDSEYIHFVLELITPIFNLSTVANMNIREFIQFRDNLDLMLNKQSKKFYLGPLGEFWSIEFLMNNNREVVVKGSISDTYIPQSCLTFFNTINMESLIKVLLDIEDILKDLDKEK